MKKPGKRAKAWTQKALAKRTNAEILSRINRGLEQANRGEGRPMRAFLEELAGQRGISLK